MQKIRPLKKNICPVRFARLATDHLPGEKNGSGIGTRFYIAVTNANKKRILSSSFHALALWVCHLFISFSG
jgi:hypothetical protein